MFLSHKHEAQQFLKIEAEQNKMQEYFLPSVTIYSVVACSMWISESALERLATQLDTYKLLAMSPCILCQNAAITVM